MILAPSILLEILNAEILIILAPSIPFLVGNKQALKLLDDDFYFFILDEGCQLITPGSFHNLQYFEDICFET